MNIMMTLSKHIPVLLQEVIEGLKVKPGGRYIDCTVDGGGHARAILEASSPVGVLLGLDVDPEALKIARTDLQSFGSNILLVEESYKNLAAVCTKYNFHEIDGILFDLGLSSAQLEDVDRGFSFKIDAPLDMRFSPKQKTTAQEILNAYKEQELVSLLNSYGEEPYGRRIARAIVSNRPITTTLQLARLIERTVGGRKFKIHPATRTFMALRIAVNDELRNLKEGLNQAVHIVKSGGRIAVISYHSLEDRIVKETFKYESKDCICPTEIPVCTCDHKAILKIVTREVVRPSLLEIVANPRSRSARLRIGERI